MLFLRAKGYLDTVTTVAAEFIKKTMLMNRKRKSILCTGIMPERTATNDSAQGLLLSRARKPSTVTCGENWPRNQDYS